MRRSWPTRAIRRAAPFAITAFLAAGAGAGSTVVVAAPATEPEAKRAGLATTAKLRLTRRGQLRFSAHATKRTATRWRARFYVPRRLTSGRYRIRIEFSSLLGQSIERYVARVRRVD